METGTVYPGSVPAGLLSVSLALMTYARFAGCRFQSRDSFNKNGTVIRAELQ